MAKQLAKKKSDRIGTGASIERNLVHKYLQRRIKQLKKLNIHQITVKTRIQELELALEWLKTQPKRALKPGGTGRK